MAKPLRKRVLGWVGARGLALLQRYFMVSDIVRCEDRGRRLGRLLYRVDRKHRERTHKNLAMIFPEVPSAERDAMAQRVYEHFGIITADFLRSPIRSKDEVVANMEVREGTRESFEAAKAVGKGVLFATAHLGNWERSAQYATATGIPLAVVARDADDSAVQEQVLRLRQAAGIEVLSQGLAARAILARLRRNGWVALLPDQNDDECFVPFFGLIAGSVLGPGVLQARTGAPIVPACCVRIGPGRYRIEAEPPIFHDPEDRPEDVMAKLNLAIEQMVRRTPDQYLWMHDRWRSARRRGLLPGISEE